MLKIGDRFMLIILSNAKQNLNGKDKKNNRSKRDICLRLRYKSSNPIE